MIKLSAHDAGKAWDTYVAVCNLTFGAPKHLIAESATALDTPPSQIPLAAKFVLCGTYAAGEIDKYLPIVTDWLKYIPRFINNQEQVNSLNSSWAERSRGEVLGEDESCTLDTFLQQSNVTAAQVVEECEAFVRKMKSTISQNDPLIFHKGCILLGIDYDEASPSLKLYIKKFLFPRMR